MKATTVILLGALGGLALGLLIAPKKVEDLRDDISDTADKWKTKWSKMIGKAEGSVDDLKKLLNKEIKGLGQDARERMLKIIDEMAEKKNKMANHNGAL
jgi:gas vesicle protein